MISPVKVMGTYTIETAVPKAFARTKEKAPECSAQGCRVPDSGLS